MTVMTLVGYLQEPYGLCGTPRLVPLADAPDWAQHGWTVMVDPSTVPRPILTVHEWKPKR